MATVERIVERWNSAVGPSGWSERPLWQRRALKTIAGIAGFAAITAFLYHNVMVIFEGRSPGASHSVQVVVETFTGTGYGSDSPWEGPVANAFVTLMDLTTFLILFIVIPYVFRPILQEAFAPTLPRAIEKTDHVVVCGVPRQGDRLVEELDTRGEEFVVVAEDEEAGLELQDRDVPVIEGDPTSAEALDRACVGAAESVVVDVSDERSASVVLAIREVDETVRTVVLVGHVDHERNLQYAGADEVVTPRHLLGRRIAERVRNTLYPEYSDCTRLDEEFALLELSVFEGSPIRGGTIEELETRSDRIVVAGLWDDGTFVRSPPGDTVVDRDTTLLLTGPEANLRELERETNPHLETDPTVVVAGYGLVGGTVVRELERSGTDCTVIDTDGDRGDDSRDSDDSWDGVDVDGDATEGETLREAGIEGATAFVVALDDDDRAILSTLAADERNPGLAITARANQSDSDTKLRRAGADYVLALPEMSGRLLVEDLLGEEHLSSGRQLTVVRRDASQFAGMELGETDLVETTCVVVGIERGEELLTDVTAAFEIRDGDRLIVVGRDEEIGELESTGGRP